MKRLILLVVLSSLLMACGTTDGQGKYRIATIGNAQRSISAEVLTADSVFIQESTNGAGGTAGGLMGGTIASQNSDNAAIVLAGIIGGAIVGDAIEANANTHEGMEYVIQTETGLLLTVAQVNKGNPIFSQGDRVVLVYGYPNRLIRDPR